MHKRILGRQFSRPDDQRKALIRSLIASLVLHNKITTTLAKAKELKRIAEKFLTKAKKGDLASRRFLNRYLPEATVKKMVNEIAPLFKTRAGGYTRVIKLGQRQSDSAEMAIIEWVEKPVVVAKPKKKLSKKKNDKK